MRKPFTTSSGHARSARVAAKLRPPSTVPSATRGITTTDMVPYEQNDSRSRAASGGRAASVDRVSVSPRMSVLDFALDLAGG
jgi:hypothetical protein